MNKNEQKLEGSKNFLYYALVFWDAVTVHNNNNKI